MKILGIETSCDETAVCLIEADGEFGPDFSYEVLGNTLYSQVAIHAPYGGVFPNLAKREHAKNLVPLLEKTLESAGMLRQKSSGFLPPEIKIILAREPELFERLEQFLQAHGKPDVDAIAVTRGPGLEPCLWVGINFAKALSLAWNVPIVGVNHMEGHIVISMCDPDTSTKIEVSGLKTFSFPLVSLLISGGHTELVLSRNFMEYELLGATRDDAAGEAFDKVARLLDLPYPGGPEISRLAEQARRGGSTSEVSFTPPMLHSKDYDFSFSGLKTEVRKLVEQNKPLSDEMRQQIALAFENAVAEVLVAKTVRAADQYDAHAVLVGGGVSANTFIRNRLQEALRQGDTLTLVPPPELATDNALMIALAGYFHAKNSDFVQPESLKAEGNLKLAST